ncbi:MAG TPA: GNAT family N-acetyltransferase [Pedococcus sp.]|nr:GNAT family N-acetyltransferase [Pedococcus sp.]
MTTSVLLRDIADLDVPLVLDLNERNVELLAPLDAARLDQLSTWAHRAQVIEVAGEPAGFVITIPAGTDYDSPNYRWFSALYGSSFHYLDRIVFEDRFRRRGLGSVVYDMIEADAATAGRLALEVNAEPPNPASLAFHAARGFAEVGRLGGPGKTVAMLAKDLTS